LVRFGKPPWSRSQGKAGVESSELSLKKLKRHIDWDTMYDDLYYGVIKVEGDCSRNGVEVLADSSIKFRGKEVFHQGDGHISSITTGSATRHLGGEDCCIPQCLVKGITEL